MKTRIFISFLLAFNFSLLEAQTSYYQIDSLLIQGEYSRVVDLCKNLIKKDSLNPELYYKLGIAYQNLMISDKSSLSFMQAVKLAPNNPKYNFSLGKYYYASGKTKLSEPIFRNLYEKDTLNWVYGYFLTDMYMQKGSFRKALDIYEKFYSYDTTNLSFLDKVGFCNIKMGDLDTARVIFEKSLSINSRNIPALKNLSYIYSKKNMIDTAIYQLNLGLKYDSTDMDLYSRRADIYYNLNYHFRARPDYLKLLASGDSSKLVLKRLGIGLAYNNQPTDALGYLLSAYQKDSNDFEIVSYIGQTYYKLKNYGKSINYYNKVLKLISPVTKQMDYTNLLLADSYKDSCLYTEAIKLYQKSLETKYSARICLAIANIYDEKLKNYEKAKQYYQLFLTNLDKIKSEFTLGSDYINNVKKRLDWIVENKNKTKK